MALEIMTICKCILLLLVVVLVTSCQAFHLSNPQQGRRQQQQPLQTTTTNNRLFLPQRHHPASQSRLFVHPSSFQSKEDPANETNSVNNTDDSPTHTLKQQQHRGRYSIPDNVSSYSYDDEGEEDHQTVLQQPSSHPWSILSKKDHYVDWIVASAYTAFLSCNVLVLVDGNSAAAAKSGQVMSQQVPMAILGATILLSFGLHLTTRLVPLYHHWNHGRQAWRSIVSDCQSLLRGTMVWWSSSSSSSSSSLLPKQQGNRDHPNRTASLDLLADALWAFARSVAELQVAQEDQAPASSQTTFSTECQRKIRNAYFFQDLVTARDQPTRALQEVSRILHEKIDFQNSIVYQTKAETLVTKLGDAQQDVEAYSRHVATYKDTSPFTTSRLSILTVFSWTMIGLSLVALLRHDGAFTLTPSTVALGSGGVAITAAYGLWMMEGLAMQLAKPTSMFVSMDHLLLQMGGRETRKGDDWRKEFTNFAEELYSYTNTEVVPLTARHPSTILAQEKKKKQAKQELINVEHNNHIVPISGLATFTIPRSEIDNDDDKKNTLSSHMVGPFTIENIPWQLADDKDTSFDDKASFPNPTPSDSTSEKEGIASNQMDGRNDRGIGYFTNSDETSPTAPPEPYFFASNNADDEDTVHDAAIPTVVEESFRSSTSSSTTPPAGGEKFEDFLDESLEAFLKNQAKRETD